ncbi:hypothetical protein Amet_0686 [Alkaliphilus metalliredigens QYMF]|uniref:DUF2877 domain-containing protein n=1 Tax=Alkaliphilus metalliredigens (strain QYMF) TaxID=293826 RepID=A6TL43_ALKMQ|nr:DUF2877 domain-containing protein [Alkaliphilus metalliredigens]ABR46911.1 hypothetical protein Amet_0686 [Alkaliphilus metalliredigens QYMF]
MIAVEICQEMKKSIELRKLRKGSIHSIFHHGLNVITPLQEVITLLSHTQGMTPLALKIKGNRPFTSIGFKRGMAVDFDNEKLVFYDLQLTILIKGVAEWNPAPCFTNEGDSLANVMEKQRWIKSYIDGRENEEGMRGIILEMRRYIAGEKLNPQLNDSQEFIFKRLMPFLEAVQERKITELSRCTKKIVGFGPGLTPAVDDFISGIMLTLIYLHHYLNKDLQEAYQINAEVIKGVLGRTTVVSEKMLKLSAKGQTSESVRQLMVAYLSKDEHEMFHHCIEEVMSLGSTSGTDFLCGIEIASQMMLMTKGGEEESWN